MVAVRSTVNTMFRFLEESVISWLAQNDCAEEHTVANCSERSQVLEPTGVEGPSAPCGAVKWQLSQDCPPVQWILFLFATNI